MHRVKINTIVENSASLYNHEFEYVGEICNIMQLNDVLLQIKHHEISGYYIKFQKETIMITPNGRLTRKPEGLFPKFTQQMEEIMFS